MSPFTPPMTCSISMKWNAANADPGSTEHAQTAANTNPRATEADATLHVDPLPRIFRRNDDDHTSYVARRGADSHQPEPNPTWNATPTKQHHVVAVLVS